MNTAETASSETQETVIIDGYIIDPETGEVLGLAGKPEFHVTDLASAEWVLDKMQAVDSEIAGLEIRLQAITEQIVAMIREKRSRREWLDRRFSAELETFAREKLDGLKERSIKTPFGTLGFRKQAGRLAVREGVEIKESHTWQEARTLSPLLAWAKGVAPEAVRVTTEFQISKLNPARNFAVGDDEDGYELPSALFEEKPESESFYIKTGVGR